MGAPPDPPAERKGGAAPAEPSMDEILASIRRILNEDEGTAAPISGIESVQRSDDVLVLDSAMMVGGPESARQESAREESALGTETEGAGPEGALGAIPGRADKAAGGKARLVAPEVEAAAAAAAEAAVSGLAQRLASEREALVQRGGPTIEDLVREEVRPLLKAWLDANLPGLVERLVRAEIERVFGRIAP